MTFPAVLDNVVTDLALDWVGTFSYETVPEVVFVCASNAGPSVMAATDVVVTMGCGDACPVYPGKRYVDWAVDDPTGRSTGEVRRIRDDIDERVRTLLAELVGDNPQTLSSGR